jgi:hypothetical protein
MKGTVVPPAIDDFGLAAVMSGYARGTIKIDALLTGDIDTGDITVFKLVRSSSSLSLNTPDGNIS